MAKEAVKTAEEEAPETEEEEGEVVVIEEPAEGEEKADGGKVEKESADDDEDERVAHTEHSDADREKIRAARRQERRDRKAHKKHVDAERERELRDLRGKVTELEGRFATTSQAVTGQNLALADQRIAECNQAIELSRRARAAAIKAGDDVAFEKADLTLTQATAALGQLNAYKQNTTAQAQQSTQQQKQQPAADPRMTALAGDFAADNPWFKMDPNTDDADSQAVFRLDASVRAAGYDPRTPEYWEELQDRVDRKFPDKLDDAAEKKSAPANGRRGPAMGGARSGKAVGKTEVFVPAALKAAMVANGSWSDLKKRNSILKRHKEAVERQSRAR